MPFELSIDEGAQLVRLARRAIETKLKTGETIKPEESSPRFQEPCGVFVTLNKIVNGSHSLRGCIGFPTPVLPLAEAVIDSAISAAMRDPRFNQVTLKEMDSIVIEVSVLTPPEVIEVERPDKYPEKVDVGRDGLIVSRGSHKGLLLPQVPVEWDWDADEFLTQCCIKAWLPPDAWLEKETKILKFQAIIFTEEAPRDGVKKVEL